jgi:ABC-type lipoprotein release transport system permease subunit
MKEATEALLDKIDWTALPAVCAVLALTALLASVGPVLRSGKTDVMVALREE